MKYILNIIIGYDTANILLDSGNDDVPDTIIFTGSKLKAKKLFEILTDGAR